MAGLSIRTKNGNIDSLVINTTSTNKLGGTINATEVTNIKEVNVTNSGVTSLSGGSNLTKIIFNGNNISNFSAIYPGISAFTNLTQLKLTSDNSLAGAVPSLDNNILLNTLDLNGNSLTGSIPSLSALSILENAVFDSNSFSGTLNSLEHTSLSSLKQFRVKNNNLTGPIPTLSALSAVEWLDFRNQTGTGFTGDVPFLSANHKLVQLYLNGNNSLSGFMPSLSAPNLMNVNISKSGTANKSDVFGFSGNFHDFNTTPELETYHAFRNNLSGSAPDLSACPDLVTIDFNENHLTGVIPYVNNLTKIKNLSLNNNGFSGHLPEFTNLTSLTYFRINANKRQGSGGLVGNIPDLSGSVNLQTLDAASNQLSGWSGSVWPSSVTSQNIQIQNNSLTTAAVDAFLAAVDAAGGTNGTLNIGGTNASPTGGASNSNRLSLVSKGWTVGI